MKKSFTYNGKRYWVERKDPDELAMAVAEKKLALKQDDIKKTNITFKEYADKWLKIYKKPYCSKDTASMYSVAINALNKYIGTKCMQDVMPEHLQTLVQAEYEKGASKSRIDKLIITMRQIFKQAEIDRIIKRNPSVSLIKPKMKENRSRALTDYEIKMILKTCETSRYGLWVKTMLLMGLRPKETEDLKWDDFDFGKGLVHIRGTKTDKADRYIPIPEALKSPHGEEKHTGYVFATTDNKGRQNRLKKQSRDRWWNYFKRELDITMGAKLYRNKIIESKVADDISPYMLRHTFATRMADKLDVNTLAQLMGHSNIQITYKYYLHYSEANMDKARSAMGDFVGDLKIDTA
jgi:integrase